MFKRFLNFESKSIASAAIIVGAASLVSKLLGVLRDRVLAGEFGAGTQLDIYYAAFRIPDLVFNLLVLGALSAGFIPVFTNYLKDRDKAWQLVNILVNAIAVVLVALAVVLFIIAPWLIKLIVPGFSGNELALTVVMSRIMFVSPILLGLSSILGGILQSFKQFFIYSLAPILYNVGIIIGALFFVPFYGIYGLAYGVVLGSVMHLLIQLPPVKFLGYKYQFILRWREPGFIQIVKMMGPRVLGLMTNQINLLVITIIASTLAAGSLTVFNFANNLQSFPLGIFGISFAIAAFPALSSLSDDKKGFVKTMSTTIRQILFFVIPASILLMVLRTQVVRIVLGTGRFDWQDTVLTLQALSMFAISLFAQSLIVLFARGFYALGDSKTPFFSGLISAVFNVIAALVLSKNLGVVGLALAFSMAAILNFIILAVLLRSRVGYLDGRKVALEGSKMVIAGGLLAVGAQLTKYIIEPFYGTETFIGIAAQGAIAGGIGLFIYFAVCWLLKTEELKYFSGKIQRKLLKKAPLIVEVMENE